MLKPNLTLSQKKIAVSAAILLIAFLAVWVFLYLPSRNTLRNLKAQLAAAQSQIKEIEEILGRGVSLAQGLVVLKGQYNELAAKFPSKEEESIKFFSESAKELNIELASIKSEPMRPLLIDKEKALIEDKICYYVPVSIEMDCFYAEFVKYAQGLKESLPALVTLEKLKMTRNEGSDKKLDIAVDLNLYLLP
ncbi:MAG: hypothetical protein V1925_00200 [Candidatus Omnitrophota bacterium]